jgi:hypothetical protein
MLREKRKKIRPVKKKDQVNPAGISYATRGIIMSNYHKRAYRNATYIMRIHFI